MALRTTPGSFVGRPSTCTSPLRGRCCVGSRLISGSSGRPWPVGSRCMAPGRKTTGDGIPIRSPSGGRQRGTRPGAGPESEPETPEAGVGPARGRERAVAGRADQGRGCSADHRRAQRTVPVPMGGSTTSGLPRVMREHGVASCRRRRKGPHHDPRTRGPEVPDVLNHQLHRRGAEPALCRRDHVAAACRRQQPLPGRSDRLLLPPPGQLVDRRPDAHRTRRRH
jgi:hypothetical protein